jgi:CO dehydrogenase/acetyl-CoA synthase alpha subunit
VSTDDFLRAFAAVTSADVARVDEEIAVLTRRIKTLRAVRPAMVAAMQRERGRFQRGRKPQLDGKIRAAIQRGGPMTMGQILAAVKCSRQGAIKALDRAADIDRDETGRWYVKEQGNA